MGIHNSRSYIFTYHPADWNDIKRLKHVKDSIKEYNARGGAQQRVVLKGRLGKKNPNAYKYQKKHTKFCGWSGTHPYQTILKADAAYFDVYIYNR